MKKIFFTLTTVVLISTAALAQINLVGTSINANGGIDIVKWQAFDSSSVTRYPSGLDGYLFASSAFNAYNSNYYLGGISADTGVLLTFNTAANTASLGNYSTFSNISEIDMSTGKIYTLSIDSIGYIDVNEFDISTGTGTLLGTIIEPGVNGIVADAIGFDSNNGIIYYIGFDETSICLYGIPVRNPVFSWTKTSLLTTTPYNTFSAVNYDNVNNILFAANEEFDSGFAPTGRWIVEINTLTGEVIKRGSLAGFPYYLAGSSSFDQFSGTFLLVAFDSAFNERMLAFNTLDNTLVAGYIPSLVSEIVCDNYSFARSAYMTTSIPESTAAVFSIYPNPATQKITVSTGANEEEALLKISGISGREFLSMKLRQPVTEIATSQLPGGVYLVTLQSSQGVRSQKLVIR